jgi:hypothetical protein
LTINYHLPDATLDAFGLPEEGSSCFATVLALLLSDLISGRYTEQQTTLFGESCDMSFVLEACY